MAISTKSIAQYATQHAGSSGDFRQIQWDGTLDLAKKVMLGIALIWIIGQAIAYWFVKNAINACTVTLEVKSAADKVAIDAMSKDCMAAYIDMATGISSACNTALIPLATLILGFFFASSNK